MGQIAQPTGFVRSVGAVFLGLAALFYLQFGLQALFQFPPQGILALVGAFGLARAAFLTVRRRRPVSALVFVGTVPLLVLHAVMTLIEPGELPFLIGSAPVPVVAGGAWLTKGASRR